MFVDFIVYYFILNVTISHIIIVKSLIIVIRKPSFFGVWTGVTVGVIGGSWTKALLSK